MNNAEFIKGINMAIEGLTAMRDAVENEGAEKNTATPTAPATKTAVGGKKAPVAKTAKKEEAAQEAPTDGQTYTTAELTGMKYNEFKKSGKKPSIFCKENLRMSSVKSYDFVKGYFENPEILVQAIKKYNEISKIRKGEYTLLDLLK